MRILLGLLILLCLTSSVSADYVHHFREQLWWQLGARDLCLRAPQECKPYDQREPRQIQMTGLMQRQIDRLNRKVNSLITYKTDFEQYGTPERWIYPSTGFGDCEDYALEKRRLLIAAGFPRRVLVLAILTPKGKPADGHAVLLVRTTDGDMVMDNNVESVLGIVLTRAYYDYHWIQSQDDPVEYHSMRAR